MIQFQKWDYVPNLTGGQQWAAIFTKTIEGEGRDVHIQTSYSHDQLEAYLASGRVDGETFDAMAAAILQVRGEPVGKPAGLRRAA